MVQSTGGNSSSQSSAIVIQGISSGELNTSNMQRFFRREALMALLIGLILAVVSFVRIYVLTQELFPSKYCRQHISWIDCSSSDASWQSYPTNTEKTGTGSCSCSGTIFGYLHGYSWALDLLFCKPIDFGRVLLCLDKRPLNQYIL